MSNAATPELRWVEPRSITPDTCPACRLTDRARWFMSGCPTLLDRGLWLVVETSIAMAVAEGSTLDPVESVFEFMRAWPAQSTEYVKRFAAQLAYRDWQVIEYWRARGEIEREERRSPAGAGGRAPGTRKARSKRKRKPGRR